MLHKSPSNLFVFMIILIILLSAGCNKDDHQVCGAESGVMLDFGCCIAWEDKNLLLLRHDTIEAVIRKALVLVNQVMPVGDVRIRITYDPSNVIPEIGIGGFNPGPNEVILSFDPKFPGLQQSIRQELEPMLAHELHHVRRRRAVGYGTTLLEACVSEGLADCFSEEISGIPPPIWSVALTGIDLDGWIQTASMEWHEPGYHHASWFFGSTPAIPRWVGYSIGYRLVKDYIAAHPTRKASDLFAEPAASFIP